MKPNSIFSRHAEKFILVGPIVEGLVGGLSAFNGVVHAYVFFIFHAAWWLKAVPTDILQIAQGTDHGMPSFLC